MENCSNQLQFGLDVSLAFPLPAPQHQKSPSRSSIRLWFPCLRWLRSSHRFHREVCWLAPSHLWVPGAPSSCWTLNKQKLWVGSQCLFRSKLTTWFYDGQQPPHLSVFPTSAEVKIQWEPGDTVSLSSSQKQLQYIQGKQRWWEEHDDIPTVHWPQLGTFRGKLYRAEKLPGLDANYPPHITHLTSVDLTIAQSISRDPW